MASEFEQWQHADRAAHDAERLVRSLVRTHDYSEDSQRAEIDRARALRAIADSHFEAAMRELGHEVEQLMRGRTTPAPSSPRVNLGVMPVWDPAGFLRAVAPADASFRWLLDAIADVRQVTLGRSKARALFDLSAVKRIPSLTEQTMLGEHAARQLAHLERAASVVAEGARTGYSERSARSLGMNLRVFTSIVEAADWLQRSDEGRADRHAPPVLSSSHRCSSSGYSRRARSDR